MLEGGKVCAEHSRGDFNSRALEATLQIFLYFASILVSVVRRDVGTIPFLIDRFCMKWGVSRLFTLSYICRASSALVLGVAGRTRSRMGAMQRQSG